MKVFLISIALSLFCVAVPVNASERCDECRRAAEHKAQACESSARSEMQRQFCSVGLRDALKKCESKSCRPQAPVADECAQCRKDVQLKAQACESGARDKVARDACTAAMKEGNAACEKRFCQKG